MNAFAERFQGSVLHLHYRTAFRSHLYTDPVDMDADLQGWMGFHNFQRCHRGYRTKGRRPAESFTIARRWMRRFVFLIGTPIEGSTCDEASNRLSSLGIHAR